MTDICEYEEYEKGNIQYLGILPETIDIVSHFREIYCEIACVFSDKYFRFIFNVCFNLDHIYHT